jgi:transglutaminase-like putative cysteine protease
MRPAADRPRVGRGVDLALELALLALSLATVAGFARLFADATFFWRLAVPTVAAHVLAAGTRRVGLGILVSGILSGAASILVLAAVLYPETLSFGLPGTATRTAAAEDLRVAWEVFGEDGPPVDVLRGFLLVAGVTLWFAAFLADWAAFRLRSVVEAILPSAAVFLFCTVFTKDRHREMAAALYLTAVLAVLLTHRARTEVDGGTWLGASRRGAGALLRAGAAVTGAAVLVAALWGPSLPGATADPLVEWRDLRDGDGARITVSPLVDIRATLVEQSRAVVFTVQAAEADYWRLTSLDRFTGLVWESSGRFGDASGDLPSTLPDGIAIRPLRQTFSVQALGDFWLPVAYEPAAVVTDGGTRPVYEPASGTLVVGRGVASADGLSYTIDSRVPVRSPDVVAGAGGPVPGEISARYLELPQDFDPTVRAAARRVTAGATSPYQQALRLQDWFRTEFVYDLAVAAGHSIDSIAQFLEIRRGYCEQFAGAYAAMARSVGLPARVAVGFTPGERSGDTFTVRGEHAHAWPEVWIAGAGWLRFEPTPGRGAPGDTAYTTVEPAQAAPGDADGAVPLPAPAPVPMPDGGVGPDAGTGPDRGDFGDLPPPAPGPVPPPEADPTRWPLVVGALLGLALVWAVVVPGLKRLRRRHARRAAKDRRDRIALTWTELMADLGPVGSGRHPAETPLEHAARVGPSFETEPALRALAALVTTSTFAPEPPGAHDEAAAHHAARAVRAELRTRRSRLRRVADALDPRPLVDRPAVGAGG